MMSTRDSLKSIFFKSYGVELQLTWLCCPALFSGNLHLSNCWRRSCSQRHCPARGRQGHIS